MEGYSKRESVTLIGKKPHKLDRVLLSLDCVRMKCADIICEIDKQMDYVKKVKNEQRP